MAATARFSFESVVRGYHVYNAVWDATNGECLPCNRESNNLHDPFAVAVIKSGTIVGHIPKKISAICSLFLRRNGTITCEVTGSRQFSEDLPQGGLEIPCIYFFEGRCDAVDKVKNLVRISKTIRSKVKEDQNGYEGQSFIKKMKLDGIEVEKKEKPDVNVVLLDDFEDTQMELVTPTWLKIGTISLTQDDLDILSGGMRLNDKHMNAGQFMLKSQFPPLQGLSLTIQPTKYGYWVKNYIQILHCEGNHWVAVSSIGCSEQEVKVYDSIYQNIGDDIKTRVKEILGIGVTTSLALVPKQIGSMDCGLFAIAFITYLAHGNDHLHLSGRKFKQHLLRSHFIECLEKGTLSEFT